MDGNLRLEHSGDSKVTFHSIEVREISGPGRILKQGIGGLFKTASRFLRMKGRILLVLFLPLVPSFGAVDELIAADAAGGMITD